MAKDVLVPLIKRLLIKQTEFQTDNKPFRVEIGYHYTQLNNLEHIRNHGLLTREDQKQLGIVGKHHGNALGDGTYTANKPQKYLGRYGNTGLLVVRIRGGERVGRSDPDARETDASDSVLDHRWPDTKVVTIIPLSAHLRKQNALFV